MLGALHLPTTRFSNVLPETVNCLWWGEVKAAGGRVIKHGAVFNSRLEQAMTA